MFLDLVHFEDHGGGIRCRRRSSHPLHPLNHPLRPLSERRQPLSKIIFWFFSFVVSHLILLVSELNLRLEALEVRVKQLRVLNHEPRLDAVVLLEVVPPGSLGPVDHEAIIGADSRRRRRRRPGHELLEVGHAVGHRPRHHARDVRGAAANGGRALEQRGAHAEDALRAGLELDALLAEEFDVGIHVDVGDVLARLLRVRELSLGPKLPLEADILESVRERVAVVDGHQLQLAILGLLHEDVARVAVGVCQPDVELRDLVNLVQRELVRSHLLSLGGAVHVSLKRAQLAVKRGQVLAVRAVELLAEVGKRRRGNPRKSVVVEDVRGNLPGGPFAHAGSLAQTLARSRGDVAAPRVVPRQGFLVHGLKNRARVTLLVSEKVRPARARAGELRSVAHREPLPGEVEASGQIRRAERRRRVVGTRGGVPRAVLGRRRGSVVRNPALREAAARDVPRDAVVVRSGGPERGDTAGSPRRGARRVPAVPGRAAHGDADPPGRGVRAELERGAVGNAVHVERAILELPASVEELGGERGLDGALCAGSHRLELGPERLGSLVGVELDLEVLGAAHLDGDVRVLPDHQVERGVVGDALLHDGVGVVQSSAIHTHDGEVVHRLRRL
mmetsp:Transcript_4097/g.18208  ORF Transcript_4097/g.18208 Transcript_4097/m.18208 type:complete len:617 (-) Transcript_4097:1327-3177(-)